MVHPDGVEYWTIVTKNPDGSSYVYLLPAVTFENLAVEYGLDETDIDTLLEVAILQLHVPEPSRPGNDKADPAAKAGHVRDGKPVTLANADSTQQAREAHLARIAWVRDNVVDVVMPQPGKKTKRIARALDVDQADDEIEPFKRMQDLKGSYRPNYMRMVKTQKQLRDALGRQV